MALGALFWMIVTNAAENLRRQNIASGFTFLGSTSGFDISQSLIEYTNTMTYGRAFIVGLTNTLRVEAATTAADATLPNCLVTAFTTAGINVKLTWGAKPEDVDSHLLAPDGSHVYFSAPGDLAAAPYANLDVDDTDSFGPEVVTITRLMQGTYRYAVHNYSGTFDPGMTGSPVRVELSRSGTLNVFTPPAGEGSNGWWHVFDLVVDANCAVTLVPVNTWLADQPPPVTVANPVLCAVN